MGAAPHRNLNLRASSFHDLGQHLPSLGLGYPIYKAGLSAILNLLQPRV